MSHSQKEQRCKAIRRAFRSPWHTGRSGRPRLIPWQDVVIVQVVKRRTPDGLHIKRRMVQGTQALLERLNGTFRQRLSC